MRILVTGHCGYIGSQVLSELRTRGHEARGFDQKEGQDLRDQVARDGVRAWAPEMIFNFAAWSMADLKGQDPHQVYLTNALGPAWIWDAAPEATFVQASTASILGLRDPRAAPYAEAKQAAESYLTARAVGRPGRLLLLRFGTVFGWPLWAGLEYMRWDLPLHRMVRDAVQKEQITIPVEPVMRPWLSIHSLVAMLARLAEDPRAVSWPDPVPLCCFNASLGALAVRVAERVPGTKILRQGEADRPGYMMPPLVRMGVSALPQEIEHLVTAAGRET